jgi:thioredoxin-dependent peroxiredoxin
MAVRLGDTAPDFTADTTQGKINFHEWLGDSWGVLFSHPKDFTPVCTTELGYVAKIKPEFDKRNVKVIGLSVDSVESHIKWEGDIGETQGTPVNFPMIGDADKHVSDLYDMIHPNANDTFTVRSVFVIGPDKKVKLTITYPASTGRNFDEILRVIDSLQLTSKFSVATPVNWEKRRRRHHRCRHYRRRSQGEVPRRLDHGQAVPAGPPPAQIEQSEQQRPARNGRGVFAPSRPII